VIILEGPDGSGKTTLSRKLSEIHNIPVMKRDQQDAFLWTMAEMSSWALVGLRIYDRFPLVGEYIYGPIRRGHVAPEFEMTYPPTVAMHTRFLQDCLIVYCRPPIETILGNVRETAQPTDIVRHIRRAITEYDGLFTHLPHVMYDYTDGKPEDLTPVIQQHWKRWQE
jgi:Cdc6-like AAA superfamily ATPase